MAAKRTAKKGAEEKYEENKTKIGKTMQLVSWAKSNSFLVIVFVLACALMFPNIGTRPYWGDESHHVLIGESITKYGYPDVKGLEGIDELLTYNIHFNKNHIYTYHPWLPDYIASVPILIFGKNNEAAVRFPFALIGICAILMVYFLALEFGLNKRAAKISTLLMLTSTALYLHSRNAIYYSMTVLLTMLIVFFYLKFIKSNEKWLEKKYLAFMTIAAVIFFYTQFLILAGILLGIALHFIYDSALKIRLKKSETVFRKLNLAIIALAFLIAFTLPWIIFAQITRQTSYIRLSSFLFNNMVGWFIFFIFFFPFILLFALPYVFKKDFSYRNLTKKLKKSAEIIKKRKNDKKDSANNLLLVLFITVSTIAVLSLNSMTPPTLRYLLVLLPFSAILIALIVSKAMEKSTSHKIFAAAILLLIILTNVLNIFPFFLMKDFAQSKFSLQGYAESDESKFLNKTLSVKFYFFSYLYEITHHYDSAVGESIAYVNERKNENDKWIFTNLDQGTTGFYTGINSTGIFSKLCDMTFDWIIVDENKAKSHPEMERCFNRGQYEKAEIINNDDDWTETPDLTSHRFITKRDTVISVYKLKE